jgi:TonB family protein
VKVTIDSRGNITMIKVVKSSGYESLDQIFISSIKKNYQFKPKRVRGKNKAGTILLSHRFK